MSHFSYVNLLAIGVDATLKATLLFLLATLVTMTLRRSSSALRHRVWLLAFCGALAVPALTIILPEWRVGILPARAIDDPQSTVQPGLVKSPAVADTVDWGRADGVTDEATHSTHPFGSGASIASRSSLAQGQSKKSWLRTSVYWVWTIGAIVCLGPLAAGAVYNVVLFRSSQPVEDHRWKVLIENARKRLRLRRSVRLFGNEHEVVPMTWGITRPIVLLPASSRAWGESRRRSVVLHELAHIQRLDLPFQLLARIACAIYWFHPLAWHALRRLRIEREQACDDCVIRAGQRASDYASELVDIAESHFSPRFIAAVAIAGSSQLEGRLRAMFDRTCSHSPVSSGWNWTLATSACLLAICVAAVRPSERAAQAAELAQAPAQDQSKPPAKVKAGAQAAQSNAKAANAASTADADGNVTNGWKALTGEQADAVTRRNLQAIMYAVHVYIDEHKGELPPAAVPNPNLAPEKRLSGFVLLLPYLGVRPSYIAEDDASWKAWHADNDAARRLFAKIDLKKAWDDPANTEAAKTIVPEFLAPSGAAFREDRGLAVSHFAFVRGSRGRDNGMFPLTGETNLAITDIVDGTSATIAIGQIHTSLGPWIAAGASSARFIDHPSAKQSTSGFGSQYPGAAYFANGDASTYFWDMAATAEEPLHLIAGRADKRIVGELARFPSANEWKKAKNLAGDKK